MKKLQKVVNKLYSIYHYTTTYFVEMKNIKRKKQIWEYVKLDKTETKKIKAIYGVKDYWHRYYTSFTGKYDLNYLPEIIYTTRLEYKLNPENVAKVLSDKSLISTMYSDIKNINIPKTIIQANYNIFLDENKNVVSIGDVKRIITGYLKKCGKVIIKPTINSNSGNNVKIIQKIEDLNIEKYNGNFVISEVIENNDDLKKLNPTSLNTFRVITYICKNEYFCAPIVLRIGVGNSFLDNIHAGGIFIAVKESGNLSKYAFSEYGNKYEFHPTTSIKFENYHIKNMDLIKDVCINCHKKTPQLKMISWDITLDKNNIPTIIEANMYGQSVWFTQIAHGCGVFGNNTKNMLDELKQK